MILTTDIANIIYKACKVFGIDVYQDGNVKDGEVCEERVVIHAKEQTSSGTWKKCFVEVNFLVPDNAAGNARLIRLNELEREAVSRLNGSGIFDGTTYEYQVSSSSILENRDLRVHFVNVKILFRVINVLENK